MTIVSDDTDTRGAHVPSSFVECERIRQKMQSMFPSVPVLSSAQFQRVMQDSKNDTIPQTRLVLVDVRSQAEQDVSNLQGAVSLSQVDSVLRAAMEEQTTPTHVTSLPRPR